MSDYVVGQRPLLEVADVIRSHGEAFLSKYGKHLSGTQKKALRDLALCRTAALGGHVERCLECGAEYNGKSGKSNSTAITIYVVVSLVLGLALGACICGGTILSNMK